MRAYGTPEKRPRGSVLDGLVGTILSQNTTGTNARAAFDELKGRFPTWAACLDADPRDVVDSIRSAGLAQLRGPRIQAILRSIEDSLGELDLDFVCEMPPPEASEYLQQFNGVGPKTASCVLLFTCGRHVFPVDTHVDRIAKRLGWVSEEMAPEAIQHLLEPLIAGPSRLALHVNLINLGRAVCRARKPKCHECPLLEQCPSGRAVTSGLTEEV